MNCPVEMGERRPGWVETPSRYCPRITADKAPQCWVYGRWWRRRRSLWAWFISPPWALSIRPPQTPRTPTGPTYSAITRNVWKYNRAKWRVEWKHLRDNKALVCIFSLVNLVFWITFIMWQLIFITLFFNIINSGRIQVQLPVESGFSIHLGILGKVMDCWCHRSLEQASPPRRNGYKIGFGNPLLFLW